MAPPLSRGYAVGPEERSKKRMNITPPLAAILLMTASAASAQTLAAPGLGGFNGAPSNAMSLGGAPAADDDMIFKCGIPPNAACTPAQLSRREAVRTSGTCSAPASKACVDYFMTGPGAANPSQTIAAYTPPAGQEWASPTCQHIPCQLANVPAKPDAPGEISAASARGNGVKNAAGFGGGLTDPAIAAGIETNKMTNGSSGGIGMTPLSATDNPARALGAQFAAYQDQVPAKGFSTAPAGREAGGKDGANAVIKVAGGTVKMDGGFTYTRLQQNAKDLRAAESQTRASGVFASPNSLDANAGGHRFRGTQAGAND